MTFLSTLIWSVVESLILGCAVGVFFADRRNRPGLHFDRTVMLLSALAYFGFSIGWTYTTEGTEPRLLCEIASGLATLLLIWFGFRLLVKPVRQACERFAGVGTDGPERHDASGM